MEEKIIEYLKNRNITVNTKTKARGHLGFYSNEKITISKALPQEKRVSVLVHEFAHKIHSEIEPDKFSKGGTLEKLFHVVNSDTIKEELLKVTSFVDENSKCLKLYEMKEEFEQKVKAYENEIKKEFPDFKKSKKFKEYEKYQRKTKCKSKYFLKYDHIKIVTPWLMKTEFYTLERLDEDFPDLPQNFKNYFYLLSNYRKQKKVQNKISKMKRYYSRPTELFARFVEGLLKDEKKVSSVAPTAYAQYTALAPLGYYKDLPEVLEIAKISFFK
ncbi:MAG: hypothetical protein K6A44_00880 [bacterium]|nr:hypothetical protein [bacterium]